MDDKALTASEVALLIGCSEYNIRKMAREKKMPFFRVGRLIRFRYSSLIRWMEKQERTNYIND